MLERKRRSSRAGRSRRAPEPRCGGRRRDRGGVASSAWRAADNISNNLDASIEPRPSHAAQRRRCGRHHAALRAPPNGDGKNGCNLTGSTTLGLSVVLERHRGRHRQPDLGDLHVVRRHQDTDRHAGRLGHRDDHAWPRPRTTPAARSTSRPRRSTSTSGAGGRTPRRRSPSPASPAAPPTTRAGARRYLRGDGRRGRQLVVRRRRSARSPARRRPTGSARRPRRCAYTDAGGLTAPASATYDIVDATAPTSATRLARRARTATTAGTRATSASTGP